MKFVKFLSITIILFFAVSLHSALAQGKKPLSFEQIFKNGEPKLVTPLPNIIGWADDETYLESKKKDGDVSPKVYAIDVKTGKEKVYRDLDAFKDIVPKGIMLNFPASATKDYTKLIFMKESDVYLLDTEKKEFKRLTETKSEEKNPTLSPDGNYVAFTRDNDLYSINLSTGKEFRYTSDGSDVVYSGYAAWIYYEEIFGRSSRYKAYYWSPDSKKIAFYRFDEKDVPMFPIYNSDGQHGFLEKTRYPKAGDNNPEVKFGIANVDKPEIIWADFNEKDDQYFGTPFWTPESKSIFVQWMNRDQNNLKIYSIDPSTGKKSEVTDEKQPSWVDWYETIRFLDDNRGFFLMSDKSGYNHIYWYSMDGKKSQQVTSGKWAVAGIELVNCNEEVIYFTAKKEASTRTDLYKINFDGSKFTKLTAGEYTHKVMVSPGGKYYITNYSNCLTPPRLVLMGSNGKILKDMGNSKSKDFDNYEIAKTRMFTIKTSDGYDLPAFWTLPSNFDQNKKYPVIIEIYGGPGTPSVADAWKGFKSQWLAKEGAIVMSVDHRGTGHFGKEGIALMHRNLGKWEMNDYIETAKWLHTQPFVDQSKICITGGSYGGYATCMAMTNGADYFTHGIAQFSVTSWDLYDSHYTERFMDSPKDNPEGYKMGSVLTYADKLKGKFQIIHGTMDDNVHMQNTIQLIDKLQDLGKPFELMLYPGERHGWGGPKATFLRNEIYKFYYKYLLEKEFPEEIFNKK